MRTPSGAWSAPQKVLVVGSAGVNRFRFTGRLAGHKLAVGSYRLTAMPMADGKVGPTTTAAFRVVK